VTDPPEKTPPSPTHEDEEEADLVATAAEVTSGPPCPKCGFPMEPGYLAAPATHFVWTSEPPRLFRVVNAEAIGRRTHSSDAYLKALRCPECRHLEAEY